MNTTHLPSICFRLLRTQHHQRLHKLHTLFSSRHVTTTSSSTRQTLFHGLETVHEDPLHGGNKYTKVPRRGLVEIEGSEAAKFLQGMCTNHIPAIQNGGDGFFAAILSPQGRVLYDVFIYPRNIGNEFPHPRFLIECDSLTTDSLVSHLKKYLLRTRAVVRDVSEEYNIWSVWGPATGRLWSDGNSVEKVRRGILSASELILKERRWSEIGCRDGRGPGMGLRLVVPCEESLNIAPDFTELADDEYTLRRILKGVPEGSDDIVPGQSLPLESNFDYMGGIDFRKGCYIGQELTIRTYHTGVTRKRIMPVQILYEGTPIPSTLTSDRSSPHPILAPGADLVKNNTQTTSETDTPLITSKRSERPIGRLGSNVSGVGLALLRLEAVMHSREELLIVRKGAEAAVEGEVDVRVKPMVPTWWPSE